MLLLARDAVFVGVLVALAVSDVRRLLLPNVLVLPAGAAGLLLSVLVDPARWWAYPVSAAGVFVALFALRAAYPGGMGMGDVKMGGMMGTFMGPHVFLAVFAAAVLGASLGGALVGAGVIGRRTPLPFGAFMAAGGLLTLFFGDLVLAWYFDLL